MRTATARDILDARTQAYSARVCAAPQRCAHDSAKRRTSAFHRQALMTSDDLRLPLSSGGRVHSTGKPEGSLPYPCMQVLTTAPCPPAGKAEVPRGQRGQHARRARPSLAPEGGADEAAGSRAEA